MNTWTKDELDRIAASDDLHIAPLREDRKTYGTLTWVWSVVVNGDLYVRAYNGKASRWYQAAILQGSGKITVAGAARDVCFQPTTGAILDQVDDAYRNKYRKSAYLAPMIGERAREATIRIVLED
ncbi:hypothetical protein LMG28727_06542 [Paraburkholderia kirstenboschensis]|uniref:DUF2255 family protein n=1 Tax=Paraburkholderia kirstenboschensis TaxID=1245436 RepID=UPI000A95C483|nr:DUF2255 family protein [Paraburkholderia kirstenboschensis]CAD6558149.1 hypothetical protein LMG28727_06542 [Paraburkholderia kirstenboschensis]